MAMGGWSPELAMDAYLHTLQLQQHHDDEEVAAATATSSIALMEPRSIEYISALAAGNQARLLIDVGPGGASSSTTAVALAIAASRTGGRLVCVRGDPRSLDGVRRHLHRLGLAASVDFQLGRPSTEAVRRLRCVDFAVVDANVESCGEVLRAIDVNPKGAIVVVTNIFQQETSGGGGHGGHGGRRCCYGQVVGKGKSMVLPIGHGMEVTKVGRVEGAHMQWQKQQKLVSWRSTPKRTFLVCDG